MPVTALHVLHGLKTPGAFYSQLEDLGVRSNIEDLSVIPAGFVGPMMIAGARQKPEFGLQTTQLASLLTECGILGANVDGSEVIYKKVDNQGDRVADNVAEHFRFQATLAFMYLESLSAGDHRIATATTKVKIIHDGSGNKPLIPAGTIAITNLSTALENYVLGPVRITPETDPVSNPITLDAADNFQLNLQPQLIEQGCSSSNYYEFCSMDTISPMITISTTKLNSWADLHETKLSNITVNLLKKDPDGDNYADIDTEHIVITGDQGGRVYCTEAANGKPARTTLQIPLRFETADFAPASMPVKFAINSAVV